jgi:3',5'-cyclic AMP phosphodiesterase CpdA
MNKEVKRLRWLVLLLVLIACKKTEDAPYLVLDKESIDFPAGEDMQSVSFQSNVDVAVTSSQAWCTTRVSGNVIEISVAENSVAGQERTAEVTVSAKTETAVIAVKQDGPTAQQERTLPDCAGMTVKGCVTTDNGLPVAGVAVSDGFELTVTDADGVYYLPSQKKNGYVFVSVPANYDAPSIDNIPQFFKKLRAEENTVEQLDFELTPSDNDSHVVLAIADWHLANRTADLNQFNTCLTDINAVIDGYRAAGTKTCILTLGDMTWDLYWYSNSYALPQYMGLVKRLHADVFNIMGNHDNNPYMPGDWPAEQAFKDIVGPSWYSFNLGKVHYVVLDNIEYVNTGGAAGVVGQRNYNNYLVQTQLDWLQKDLALVQDKTAPLVIAMHIPLYKPSDVDNSVTLSLDNGQQLLDKLAGFSDVHVLTGHLHYNFTVIDGSVTEHNIGALCATWWWTGNAGYAGNHICKDGSVGGYSVWELEDKNARWYYKSIAYDRNYQFRTYDLNTIAITADTYTPSANAEFKAKVAAFDGGYGTAGADNEVLINVFNYDKDWKVEVSEGSTPLPVTRVSAKDPLHIISYECQRLNRNADPTADFVTNATSHIFKATALSANGTLTIKVTDRFGNVYTENMTRPKAFSYTMK